MRRAERRPPVRRSTVEHRTAVAHAALRRAAGAVVALTAGALVVGVLTPTTAVAAPDVRTLTAAQLYGAGPYRSDTSEAARAATALAATDPAGAAAARTIAQYPVATWLGDWTTGTTLTRTIDAALAGAAKDGTTPVFVTYAIPHRDCGGYSAGGFDETTYAAWVDQIASRLAGHRAAVIVEPDSLAMLSNSACDATLGQQRSRILSREVDAFAAAGVAAYLDAGNSNWVPPAVMAARLDAAGVRKARGFFTNVANYYPTDREQTYAERVSAATGGSHYVIDTSRNGQGWRGTWCNGPGAGLGTTPRVVADGSHLDALLWVKTPGASDGTCGGGPAAGKWWSAFAQALVANARLGTPAPAPKASATPSAKVTAAPKPTATPTPKPAVTPKPTATPRPAAPGVRPTVHRDQAVSASARRLTVRGWAFDRDDLRRAVSVRVLVDGRTVTTVAAAGSRPDVDRAYGVGATHGFHTTVSAASGKRKVCLTAVGIGAGGDTSTGCVVVTVR
ncbi:glycoside hydrolase family 6 protein [Curtobacterium caseinilyticum]|uniref:Glucanase n=1 Tax=Curtobacterium caseinilyticum TaxID=3055137 RepID=A0ABT7TT86_9MICO|nr:glycoside hydrolase family 6 protein [Curtobacterium caseinilyticum]MDM7892726.1 glycoside hydrolase family 6 protein [Curtobacterium caseinilyticum]